MSSATFTCTDITFSQATKTASAVTPYWSIKGLGKQSEGAGSKSSRRIENLTILQVNTYFGDISDIYFSRVSVSKFFWLPIKFLFSFIKLEYSYKDTTDSYPSHHWKFAQLKFNFIKMNHQQVENIFQAARWRLKYYSTKTRTMIIPSLSHDNYHVSCVWLLLLVVYNCWSQHQKGA